MEENDQTKKSLIIQLIGLAKSDGNVHPDEIELIGKMMEQLGMDKSSLRSLFEEEIRVHPPKGDNERLLQFHRLVLIMNIDREIDREETKYLKNLGIQLGLLPAATNEILKVMKDYPNKVIPPERFVSIFKTFYN